MANFWENAKKAMNSVVSDTKKYLDDNYLGTVECAHCKATGKIHSFKKTEDGALICPACMEKLPYQMRDSVSKEKFERINAILTYIGYSHRVLAPKFKSDLSYGFLQVDRAHGLIKVDNVYIELRNLEAYVLTFEPTETAGMMQTKVRGDVRGFFAVSNPNFSFFTVADSMVTAHLRPSLSAGVVYKEPKKLEAFKEELDRVIAFYKGKGTQR